MNDLRIPLQSLVDAVDTNDEALASPAIDAALVAAKEALARPDVVPPSETVSGLSDLQAFGEKRKVDGAPPLEVQRLTAEMTKPVHGIPDSPNADEPKSLQQLKEEAGAAKTE